LDRVLEKAAKFIFGMIYGWGKLPLREAYPRIYANTIYKDLKIEDLEVWQGQMWV